MNSNIKESSTCDLCTVELSSIQEQLEHDFSLIHHMKLHQKHKKLVHRCSLCLCQVGPIKGYVSHLHGSKHQKALKLRKDEWTKSPPVLEDLTRRFHVVNYRQSPKNKPQPTKKNLRENQQKNNSGQWTNDRPNKSSGSMNFDRGSSSSMNSSRHLNNKQNFVYHNFGSRNPSMFQPYPPPRFNQQWSQHQANWFRPQMNWRNNYGNNNFESHTNWNNQQTFSENPSFNSWTPNPNFGFRAEDRNLWNNMADTSKGLPDHVTSTSDLASEPTPNEVADSASNKTTSGLVCNVADKSNRSLNKKDGERRRRVELNSAKQRNKKNGKEKRQENEVVIEEAQQESHPESEGSVSSTTRLARQETKLNQIEVSDQNMKEPHEKGLQKTLNKTAKNESVEKTMTIDKESEESNRDHTFFSSTDVKPKLRRSVSDGSRKSNRGHTYFLSSDSDSERQENECSVDGSSDAKQSSDDNRSSQTLDKSKDNESYNKALLNRLINFPCTRKQQLQLAKWVQEHSKNKKKLYFPRFNMHLVPSGSEKEDEHEDLRRVLSQMMTELPGDTIEALVDVLEHDSNTPEHAVFEAILRPDDTLSYSDPSLLKSTDTSAVEDTSMQKQACEKMETSESEQERIFIKPDPDDPMLCQEEPTGLANSEGEKDDFSRYSQHSSNPSHDLQSGSQLDASPASGHFAQTSLPANVQTSPQDFSCRSAEDLSSRCSTSLLSEESTSYQVPVSNYQPTSSSPNLMSFRTGAEPPAVLQEEFKRPRSAQSDPPLLPNCRDPSRPSSVPSGFVVGHVDHRLPDEPIDKSSQGRTEYDNSKSNSSVPLSGNHSLSQDHRTVIVQEENLVQNSEEISVNGKNHASRNQNVPEYVLPPAPPPMFSPEAVHDFSEQVQSSCEQNQEKQSDTNWTEMPPWFKRPSPETFPPEPDSPQAAKVSSQSSSEAHSLVDKLLALSKQEEALRGQSQKVDQIIGQMYKVLEEWKQKRSELQQEEVELRKKRLGFLEMLQGSLASDINVGVQSSPSPSPQAPPPRAPPPDTSGQIPTNLDTGREPEPNLTYLGTLDSTWDLISQLGLNMPSDTTSLLNGPVTTANPKTKKKKNAPSSPKKKKKAGTKAATANTQAKATSLTKGKKKRKADEVLDPAAAKKAKKKKKAQREASVLKDLVNHFVKKGISSAKAQNKSVNERCSDKTEVPSSSADVMEVVMKSETPFFDTFGPIQAHQSAIIEIKVSNGFLYTCSADKTAKRFEMQNPETWVHYKGHEKTVSAINVVRTEERGEEVYTTSHDGYLRCFDPKTGIVQREQYTGSSILCLTEGFGNLYLGLNNGQVWPYKISSCKFLEPFEFSQTSVSRIATGSEGLQRLLCVVTYDGNVSIRNAVTGLLIRLLNTKVRPPCFLQVDGSEIFITTTDRSICVYDLSTGFIRRKIPCSSAATGLHVVKDYIVVCSFDGLIRCYYRKNWVLHKVYYGAGKSMAMSLYVFNNWIYSGNRHGAVEAFKTDHQIDATCQFQNCGSPFGLWRDLNHHLMADHMSKLSLELVHSWLRCPWKNCHFPLKSLSAKEKLQELEDHVVNHIKDT